jgi:uncharacterized membrane protein
MFESKDHQPPGSSRQDHDDRAGQTLRHHIAALARRTRVLVAVIGFAFLGDKLSLVNWLGIVLAAGGALLVAL